MFFICKEEFEMNEQVVANPRGTERVGKLMIRYAIPSIIWLP